MSLRFASQVFPAADVRRPWRQSAKPHPHLLWSPQPPAEMADRDNQSGWLRPSWALRCRLSSQGAWKGRTCPELTSQSLNTDLHPGVLWIRCDSDYGEASIQLSTIQPHFVYPCEGDSWEPKTQGEKKMHIFSRRGRKCETTAAFGWT